MPLFNKEREVSRAIRSVLAQTFHSYEIIVVNDGSTDNGPAILRAINDPRIHIIDQKNAGVSAARNRGINEGKADLIAFLDADDEWLPNFLETISRLKSNFPSCSVFATNYLYQNVDGLFMPTIVRGLPKGKWEGVIKNYFKVASQSDPPIWSSAVAVRKAALASIGGFPIGVKVGEDLITWAKLGLQYKIAYSTYPGAIFYLRESLWGRPTRIPDSVDMVGKEFERMLDAEGNKEIRGLKEYIAHWHQMRASVFLRLGKRKEAINEVKKIAGYSKKNPKLYVFFAIALLPQKICNWVLRTINYLKYFRRAIILPKITINISK
jgi:glycosyltransferase involved in cell wall biosynthesis